MPEEKIKISPAKGRPMLRWVGKQPLDYVKGFPAQLVEVFDPLNTGQKIETPTFDELKDNWQNLLFHGDNKEVMATLIENGFRGKIDLIYIDPPFMSGADYVRKVELRGLKETRTIVDDADLLQQTMYFDMWNNDAYLQFMYERLILLKELLCRTGSIYVHLDQHVGHYMKLVMDEIFGTENFRNEIVWCYTGPSQTSRYFVRKHDTILFYSKSDSYIFNCDVVRAPYKKSTKFAGRTSFTGTTPDETAKALDKRGKLKEDWWNDIAGIGYAHGQITGFSTQKLGRRWIGCDINKGAVQMTSKRLQKIILEQIKKGKKGKHAELPQHYSLGIYQVNNYDLQLLRTEATELAAQHIGVQRVRTDTFFDGYLGKSLVKIIDFNHPLTLLDLQLIQDELKKRPNEDRDITIVCLGKELAVDPQIEEWNKKHPVNKLRVIELKTDKKYGHFLVHKPAEAKIAVQKVGENKAVVEIEDFISPTIIERLNIASGLFRVKIPDFRSMIDTVLIDNNYDDKTFHVVYSDVPEKKEDLVKGKYEVELPNPKAKIAVKIVDMLGEEILVTCSLTQAPSTS